MVEGTNTGENKRNLGDLGRLETMKERKLRTENWKSTTG